GSFLEADECTAWLNRWLNQYCVNPVGATEETRAKRPLTEGRVEVRPVRSKPGWYEAGAHLRPPFQLAGLSTSLRLVAEGPRKGGGPRGKSGGAGAAGCLPSCGLREAAAAGCLARRLTPRPTPRPSASSRRSPARIQWPASP